MRSPDFYRTKREEAENQDCEDCQYNIKGPHKVKDHPTEQLFYVQDTRQIVGNCMLWWNPRSQGYTTEIDQAGFYTEKDIKTMRATDVGWPKEFIDEHWSHHVRRDRIQQAETVKTIRGK